MTLEEMIERLEEYRTSSNSDLPVRLVFREGELGLQFNCIELQLTEGLHGNIVLLFAGENAATMDWPTNLGGGEDDP